MRRWKTIAWAWWCWWVGRVGGTLVGNGIFVDGICAKGIWSENGLLCEAMGRARCVSKCDSQIVRRTRNVAGCDSEIVRRSRCLYAEVVRWAGYIARWVCVRIKWAWDVVKRYRVFIVHKKRRWRKYGWFIRVFIARRSVRRWTTDPTKSPRWAQYWPEKG